MPSAHLRADLADLFADLADLVVPRECGGCGVPGARCCPACRALLASASPRPWTPDPCPRGFPSAWACLPYEGSVRGLVVAWKDGGRRDVTALLAPVLTRGCAAAVAALLDRADAVPTGGLSLVPVPSSAAANRARGDRPLVDLCRTAATRFPHGLLPVLPVLAQGRAVADQAGLDHRARARNLAGSMVVAPRAARRLAGAHCLVVDDVVTTGATLSEATRALQAAGARSVVAVTVAATQRRGGRRPPGLSSGIPGG